MSHWINFKIPDLTLATAILVPVDFSYATSYRQSKDAPFSHNTFRTDRRQTDRRNTVS